MTVVAVPASCRRICDKRERTEGVNDMSRTKLPGSLLPSLSLILSFEYPPFPKHTHNHLPLTFSVLSLFLSLLSPPLRSSPPICFPNLLVFFLFLPFYSLLSVDYPFSAYFISLFFLIKSLSLFFIAFSLFYFILFISLDLFVTITFLVSLSFLFYSLSLSYTHTHPSPKQFTLLLCLLSLFSHLPFLSNLHLLLPCLFSSLHPQTWLTSSLANQRRHH